MNERELIELENEDEWDFDQAVVHPPSESARAVVPVRFESGEFERLAAYARERGMALSVFIREAALASIPEDQPEVTSDSSEIAHPEPLE